MGHIEYRDFYEELPLDMNQLVKYESPSNSIFWNERKKLFLRKFEQLEKEKKINVLDVGCNTGKTLFELFRNEKNQNEYWGIDINKISLSFAKEYSSKLPPRFHFEKIDISKPRWNKQLGKKFDLIIFSEVIEHLYPAHQEIVLKELQKLTSNKGVIIITCPNKSCIIKKIIRFGQQVPKLKKYISKLGKFEGLEGHVAEPSFLELNKIVKRNGFEIIQHKGLTFSYGHKIIDDSAFLTCLFVFLNKFFGNIFPFWAFDQYIILKDSTK